MLRAPVVVALTALACVPCLVPALMVLVAGAGLLVGGALGAALAILVGLGVMGMATRRRRRDLHTGARRGPTAAVTAPAGGPSS